MMEKSTLTFVDRLRAHVEQRNQNDRALIEGPLAHLSDRELRNDVKEFSKQLPDVKYEAVLRAARVAKDIRTYDQVARGSAEQANLPVQLFEEEMRGLVSEHDELRGQFHQIFPVILTVGCAAFLQGHVQASINCASLYVRWLECQSSDCTPPNDSLWKWKLGAANSSPFFAAAIIGAPSALLLNFWVGRRGAITVAAMLILASSLGSAWVNSWWQLLCVRIVNGVGMGIKAISTPILAGEIAYTQWRGSSTLMWQLWVAFGIAIGSALNLAIAAWNHAIDENATRDNQIKALREILGAPFIPAVILLIALGWCMESPRYYMQPNTPHRNPSRAFDILLKARRTELQALRDLYLIHKSVELDEYRVTPSEIEHAGPFQANAGHAKAGLTYASQCRTALSCCSRQYALLFTKTKLKNAVLSTCVVALAQQLCGINVFAFYSNTFFVGSIGTSDTSPSSSGTSPTYLRAMGYSAGFGAVNFVFCLLAVRRIDTWGRRKLMLTTLPLMSLCLAAAAMLFINGTHLAAIVVFIYLFAAVYSPSLGPIPFTLASESFPLAQREAGCSVAIAVNLFFAGVLTLLYPRIDWALHQWGGLAVFAALNLVAFVLVFLLVEETKGFSLEDLSMVFAVPKGKFVAFQLEYLGYLWRKYTRPNMPTEVEPEFYHDALKYHHENLNAGVRSENDSDVSGD